MHSRLVWFDDDEPFWPEWSIGSYFFQKLILMGMWVVAVVDYPTAADLSYLIIPLKKT